MENISNKLARILVCLALIYPSPVFAEETTTYERISDTGQNTTDISFDYGGSSWNRLDIHSGQCGSNNQAVHYNMQNLDDQTITITFPEENITTAGFLSGCVNDPYPITWTYSDGTTETVNYSAQSNADVATMYEVVSKSVTGKYITSVAIEYDDYVILDDIFWTFDNTPATTTTTTTSTTTTSTTTTSTTTTSTTTTTTVPPTTTTTTTTTTTVPPTTTTTTVPITTPNAPTNVSVNYGGEDVYFSWEYEAGEIEVLEFHINYSYDNQTWTRVVIDDTTARTYTLDKSFIQTGTFYWEIASCGDLENNQSCANGDSNSFETTEYVPPTTTTIPPAPEPEPEPVIVLPPEPIQIVVIMEDGSEAEYEESEILDGTVERDNERKANEDKFGCFMTNAQIERGDCDIEEEFVEEDIIIEYEEESNTEGEFFDDDDMVFELELEDEDIEFEQEFIELSEEEILELEEQMERDAKALELEDTMEILEFESEEEADEFIKVILELEEINYEEEFGIEDELFEIQIEFDDEEIFVVLQDEELEEMDLEIEDESDEKIFRDDKVREDEVLIEEETEDDLEVLQMEDNTEEDEKILLEEVVAEQIEELEEVIEEVIEIEEIIEVLDEDELEELTEEELIEYEEAKEEAIEEYVEELETEEVIQIVEEIADVGVENLESVSEEVIEVVAKVVEEVIQIAQEEELTVEQEEVVAEVFNLEETEDVSIIAEAVADDSEGVIAQAVEDFVESAVENAESALQPYTLADVVVEKQFEIIRTEGIGAIIDTDFSDIKISEIGSDMSQDQREKAQEVIVPTILVRLASVALFRKTI